MKELNLLDELIEWERISQFENYNGKVSEWSGDD